MEIVKLDERMTDETKEFVKKFAEPFVKSFETGNIKEVRELIEKRDLESRSKVNYVNIEEREYFVRNEIDGYMIPVTVYINKNVTPDAPFILHTHGGGWRIFSRKTFYPVLGYLAENLNSIWVSVEYRLSPEHKHPIGLQDCCSVLKWMKENKTSLFSLNEKSKIGILGDSAGGHLAACLTHEIKNILSFQILLYPFLDLTLSSNEYVNRFNDVQYMIPKRLFPRILNEYLNDVNDTSMPEVSPMLRTDFTGIPQCLIISAELDPLIGDAYNYTKKLKENNIPVEMYVMNGTVHGYFHSYTHYTKTCLECLSKIISYIKGII